MANISTIKFPCLIEGKIDGATVQTVNARDLHAFLENGDNFTDWIRDRIRQFDFEEDVDFIVVSENSRTIDKDGYPRASTRREYHLSLEMAKELSMVERNAKGKQARTYFLECEKRAKANGAIAIPDFSNPVAAARAWADKVEALQIAEAARQSAESARLIAEQTKAQIGSKREASAMNRASQEAKRANKLEIELDKSMQFATVKRMQIAYPGRDFNWRKLREASIKVGAEIIDVFDANYGSVKAYKAGIWLVLYGVEIPPRNDA